MRSVVFTCEHGGNEIPEEYIGLFKNAPELSTHQGFDAGALDLFYFLEEKYAHFSASSTISRLLVELNRSVRHPKLFSAFTKNLPAKTRKAILEEYYFPYRNSVTEEIRTLIGHRHQIVHIGIHSFTPVWNGEERHCDVGLLYDPQRALEKNFCVEWKSALLRLNPTLNVRFNYPYRGNGDGFTTYLRNTFPTNYLGLELEVNQKFAHQNTMENTLKTQVADSLEEVLGK